MNVTKHLGRTACALALLGGPGVVRAAGSVTFATIYSFSGQPGVGNAPSALLQGPGGVLYGVSHTFNETAAVNDLVFTLTPSAGGAVWRFADIHDFANPGRGGVSVEAMGPPSMDSLGRLYGATSEGGFGQGSVWRLMPPTTGQASWGYSELYPSEGYGDLPSTPIPADGYLFGTTGADAVYRLVPPGPLQNPWQISFLHYALSFSDPDGSQLDPALIARYVKGVLTLFGEAQYGGKYGHGTIFELTAPTPPATAWTYAVLHDLDGKPDGANPQFGLIADASLHLYGVTASDGSGNKGTAFRLSPPAPGQSDWTYSVLHAFGGMPDGALPSGPLVENKGVLYGVTSEGGVGCPNDPGCGTVFRLTPRDPGGISLPWNETTLYRFPTKGATGGGPGGGLALDASNPLLTSLYGVAGGGAFNKGAVYRVQVPQ